MAKNTTTLPIIAIPQKIIHKMILSQRGKEELSLEASESTEGRSGKLGSQFKRAHC